MAEALRRVSETNGSDVVRRLIARPIRLDPPRLPAAPPAAFAAPDRSGDRPYAAEAAYAFEITALKGGEIDDATFDDEAEDDVLERLQAEMAVMKAIMMAERAEVASLRARIALHDEPEPIGAEARAVRDRWAGMVDRILMSAR